MEKPEFTRRSILTFGWMAFLVTLAGVLFTYIRSLMPNVLYEPPTKVKLGRPEEYAPGTATFVPEQRFFLFREKDGFTCVSAICSHLGCTINPFDPPDAEFSEPHSHCPCHGSVFAKKDGRVLRSPAPQSLGFYHISLTLTGRIVVDTNRKIGPDFILKG